MKDWGNYTEEEKFRKYCCEANRCEDYFILRQVDSGNGYLQPSAGNIIHKS